MMSTARPDLRSEELRESWRELRDAGEEAEALAADLTPAQLWWRPDPERWSVGACLYHLVRTGEAYLDALDEAVADGRERGLVAEGGYRRSLVGRLLAWSMEPPPRLKVPAPAIIRPRVVRGERAAGRPTPPGRPSGGDAPDGESGSGAADPLPRFLALRARLAERLEAADGLDLGRIRVTSPFFSFVRFDLGSAFRIVAAHERRHLWQARKVLEEEGFPRG